MINKGIDMMVPRSATLQLGNSHVRAGICLLAFWED